ncbi:hypothetical protein PInf_003326 [Phytophthora infestans]|nr:hypothetical protein PInf_003326 [Phytophthora infestans]
MLTRLTSLRCSHNSLTTPLESGLGDLTSLRYVDLAENRLVELEPCLYELPEVEVLNLYGNRITMLPREMAQHCRALRKLDLYNNGLHALPLELADGLFAQLDVISIGRNPLTLLPEKMSSTWKMKDQYQTSFANGYTPTETKAWVADNRRQRLERAGSAIEGCDRIRAHLKAVYRADADVLVPAMKHAHERRVKHEKKLLKQARHDAQEINAGIKEKTEAAQGKHKEAQKLQRTEFADEMKRLARERQQMKQQKSSLRKPSTRKIVATAEDCEDDPEREH